MKLKPARWSDLWLIIRGPVYIRLDRGETPLILDENYQFTLGRPTVIAEGTDVTIFATGQMVSLAMQAAEVLGKEGISAEVVNVGTIKPMNADAVVALAEKTGAVVTVEEHSIYGGLGSAIAESLMPTKIPIVPIGVQDRFGQSAKTYEELLAEYGLTQEAVCQAVKNVLALK